MHGSFIRKLRLDCHKPTPIPFDTSFHFGASTRHYVLKERPPVASDVVKPEDESQIDLPKEQEDLDNLTEYHTALNKRITSIPIQEPSRFPKKKRKSVIFAEREEVINPGNMQMSRQFAFFNRFFSEDIDASVGRFRNMISVEVIPNKKLKTDISGLVSTAVTGKKHVQEFYNKGLYEDLDRGEKKSSEDESSRKSSFIPDLAPDISEEPIELDSTVLIGRSVINSQSEAEALNQSDSDPLKPKKKYIKEAWPGRRSGPSLLV